MPPLWFVCPSADLFLGVTPPRNSFRPVKQHSPFTNPRKSGFCSSVVNAQSWHNSASCKHRAVPYCKLSHCLCCLTLCEEAGPWSFWIGCPRLKMKIARHITSHKYWTTYMFGKVAARLLSTRIKVFNEYGLNEECPEALRNVGIDKIILMVVQLDRLPHSYLIQDTVFSVNRHSWDVTQHSTKAPFSLHREFWVRKDQALGFIFATQLCTNSDLL